MNAAIGQLPLTRIVIAHRPETIAMAERVLVLEQGRIVADVLAQAWRAGRATAGAGLVG